jgi:hypothetical protein
MNGAVLAGERSMNDYVTRQEFQRGYTILERIESKLEGHDRRFDAIDARFERIDARFEKVEEGVRHQGVLHERLESKVDAVIEVLGTKASRSDVENLRAEIVPRLDVIESVMRAS